MLGNDNHLPGILFWLVLTLTTIQAGCAEIMNQEHHHEIGQSEQVKTYGFPGDNTKIDRIIEIMAIDMAFIPTSISVNRGETIKFVVTNQGKLLHELVLGTNDEQAEHNTNMRSLSHDDMGQHMQSEKNGIVIHPSQTQEITWTFTTELTQIQFACHVPGHFEAGMFGSVDISNDES